MCSNKRTAYASPTFTILVWCGQTMLMFMQDCKDKAAVLIDLEPLEHRLIEKSIPAQTRSTIKIITHATQCSDKCRWLRSLGSLEHRYPDGLINWKKVKLICGAQAVYASRHSPYCFDVVEHNAAHASLQTRRPLLISKEQRIAESKAVYLRSNASQAWMHEHIWNHMQ